jgi:hypothetical protein
MLLVDMGIVPAVLNFLSLDRPEKHDLTAAYLKLYRAEGLITFGCVKDRS